MEKQSNKVGRPRIKEPVSLMGAYLKKAEKVRIVKKYGSLTDAVKKEILPKC